MIVFQRQSNGVEKHYNRLYKIVADLSLLKRDLNIIVFYIFTFFIWFLYVKVKHFKFQISIQVRKTWLKQ